MLRKLQTFLLRDERSTDRILNITFLSTAGIERIQMPANRARPEALKREILAHGGRPTTADLVQIMRTEKVVTTTVRTGFRGEDLFVTPTRCIGPSPKKFRFPRGYDSGSGVGQRAGSLDQWADSVGQACCFSHFLTFAVSIPFASLLPTYLAMKDSSRPRVIAESTVFNFFGESASGKTTALRACASVFGNPEHLIGWNFTQRSLEEVCATANDLPLILDDLESCPETGKSIERTIRLVTQAVATGRSRGRSASVADKLPPLTWQTIGISTHIRPVREVAAGLGWEMSAGELVRMVDVPIPSVSSAGIFDALGDETASATIALLERGLAASYGCCLDPYLEALRNQDHSKRVLNDVDRFLRKVLISDDPWERRLASKFALIGAGGELARRLQLVPWWSGWALQSARACYESALAAMKSQLQPLREFAQNVLYLCRDPEECLPVDDLAGTIELPHLLHVRGPMHGENILALRSNFLSELPTSTRRMINSHRDLILKGHGSKSTAQLRVRLPGEAESRPRFYLLRIRVLREIASGSDQSSATA